MQNIFYYIASFCLLILLQSLFINGWHECFRFNCVNDIKKGEICNGNIFFKIFGKFIKKHNGKTWTLPIWGCVKCQASIIGSITFWLTVYPIIGFDWYLLWVWIADVFILVPVNFIIYKK